MTTTIIDPQGDSATAKEMIANGHWVERAAIFQICALLLFALGISAMAISFFLNPANAVLAQAWCSLFWALSFVAKQGESFCLHRALAAASTK